MNRSALVPSSKFDTESAERAVTLGWPGVEPVLPELLEWLRDYNWPVAHVLAPFLAGIGDPLAPYLRPILDGEDVVWKYWIITVVLQHGPITLAQRFRAGLERLVQSPTPLEAEHDLPEVAEGVLHRLAESA